MHLFVLSFGRASMSSVSLGVHFARLRGIRRHGVFLDSHSSCQVMAHKALLMSQNNLYGL